MSATCHLTSSLSAEYSSLSRLRVAEGHRMTCIPGDLSSVEKALLLGPELVIIEIGQTELLAMETVGYLFPGHSETLAHVTLSSGLAIKWFSTGNLPDNSRWLAPAKLRHLLQAQLVSHHSGLPVRSGGYAKSCYFSANDGCFCLYRPMSGLSANILIINDNCLPTTVGTPCALMRAAGVLIQSGGIHAAGGCRKRIGGGR